MIIDLNTFHGISCLYVVVATSAAYAAIMAIHLDTRVNERTDWRTAFTAATVLGLLWPLILIVLLWAGLRCIFSRMWRGTCLIAGRVNWPHLGRYDSCSFCHTRMVAETVSEYDSVCIRCRHSRTAGTLIEAADRFALEAAIQAQEADARPPDYPGTLDNPAPPDHYQGTIPATFTLASVLDSPFGNARELRVYTPRLADAVVSYGAVAAFSYSMAKIHMHYHEMDVNGYVCRNCQSTRADILMEPMGRDYDPLSYICSSAFMLVLPYSYGCRDGTAVETPATPSGRPMRGIRLRLTEYTDGSSD